MLLNRLFLRCPVLIICHNVLPHETRRYDVLLAKLTLRLATHLIVQSEEEEQRLLALAPHASSSVVPHPLYDMFVHQSTARPAARAPSLGCRPRVRFCSSSALFVPIKGCRNLSVPFQPSKKPSRTSAW